MPRFNFNAIIESTVGKTITEALTKAEIESFNLLRASRQMCVDYYSNEVLAENGGKDEYLKNFFGIKNESHVWEYRANLILEHIPLTEQLIDLKARNYIQQPERKVKNKQAEKYAKLLKDSGFFSLAKRIEQQMQLLHDVAVGVFVYEGQKKLYFQVVRDYFPIYDPDDKLGIYPAAIIYPTAKRNADGSVVYAYYDKDVYTELDKTGKETTKPIPNPYGILPFFFVHRRCPIDSHFSQPREELARTNQAIDVAVVGLNNLMRANGFKQFVVVGGSVADAKKLALGNAFAMHIEAPQTPSEGFQPTVEVIDMQANFSEHINAINFKMERATNTLNLIVDWRIEGGPALPGTLKLQNAKDTEDRQAQVEILDEYIEQPLYKIVSVLSKSHSLGVEEGELSVDFPEPEVQTTPEQDIAKEKHDLEIGKITVVDLMMQDNPDLDEKEAAEKLAKNIKLNAYLNQSNVDEETILKILDGVDVDVETNPNEPPEPNAGEAGQSQGGSGALV